MWFYALEFVTSRVSADAFSLFYYEILIEKLSVFGAESHCQFVNICSCIICDNFSQLLSFNGLDDSACD